MVNLTAIPQGSGGTDAVDDNGPKLFTTMNGQSSPTTPPSCKTTNHPLTTPTGAPIRDPAASQRIGNQLRGTTLLQDTNLIELIQSLDRERIPER